MAKKTWTKVDDKNVRHVWKCQGCAHTVTHRPSWYQDNGTLAFGCPDKNCNGYNRNMIYVRTEISKPRRSK